MHAFLYPIQLSLSVVFHSTCDPWNQPGWETQDLITCIPHFIVICSNSCTKVLDLCSPSYASMTFHVIEVIWYDICKNPRRTLSSMKVSMTRNITHKLCVYNLATSFDRRPLSHAATMLAFCCAPCLNIIVLLRIHAPVKGCYWHYHSTSAKSIPSRRNGHVRVHALLQSCQRHPGGRLLCARRQYHASCSILPSECIFTISSRFISLLF